MAHNSYIRGGIGSGAWTNVVVLGTDLEKIDSSQMKSVNGDDGGAWAPTAAIVIGGSGLIIHGQFIVDTMPPLFVAGFRSIGAVEFDAAAVFYGPLTINSGAQIVDLFMTAPDANLTVTPGTHSRIYVPVATGRQFTLSTTGAVTGTTFEISCPSTTGLAVINGGPAGGSLATLNASDRYGKFVFDGTNYVRFR